jgi:hypothetical protein
MALVPTENSPAQDSYYALLGEIKERIRSAQYAALRTVNLELLSLSWDIGRAHRPTASRARLGGVLYLKTSPRISSGASPLLTCGESNSSTEPTLRTKNSHYRREKSVWTKNLVILERCKDAADRQFYLEHTKQFGWTKNVLIHACDCVAFSYRRTW